VSNDLPPKSEVWETPCLALRPREAARALGVSERTLWTWTSEGTVPHVRHGKIILYPVDALRHWLNAKQTTPTTSPVLKNIDECARRSERGRPEGGAE